MSDALIGTQLGQYQLIEMIGRGGMARVYKAYQPALDRYVAIKVLLHQRDPQFAARFTREARAIARLQHHNIVPIYDYSAQEGLPYIVMQYIENGVTLDDLLGQPLMPAAALQLMLHLLDALDYAHRSGMVHRDIKPANILLPTPTWPMLTDFGIAKFGNDSLPALTVPGLVLGTPSYMAPEQATGQPVDARTDLYATGVLLYEMLTGQVPFSGDTALAVLTKHVGEPPPPARTINPDLPPAVETMLLKAMAKKPAERYQSAADLAAELKRLLDQLEQDRANAQRVVIYQAGLQAFRAGHWDEAVEQFNRLVAHDPTNAEASDLLRTARDQRERARAEARRQSDLARQSSATPTAAPNGPARTRETNPLPPLDAPAASATAARAGGPAAQAEPAASTSAPPAASRRRAGLVWVVAAVAVVIALIGLILSRWGGPATQGAAPTATAGSLAATASQPTAAGTPPPARPTAGAPLPNPAGQLVYQDNFADLNKSGLENRPDDADFARGPGAQGGYQISLSKPNNVRWAVLPRQAYLNFTLRVDLRDASDNFEGAAGQGVIFRTQDDTHLYAALVDPRTGRYAIQKSGGAEGLSDPAAWKESPLVNRQGDVNQLRVDAQGDQFTIYLNGALLDSFQDQANGFGMLGLIAANLGASAPRMLFDNLMIWSDDTAPQASQLPTIREMQVGDMVLIPGGPFIMGSNQASAAQPPHIVDLPDFYIDRAEVANIAYQDCFDRGGCQVPQPLDSATHPNYVNDFQFASFPVINVAWEQARTFCAWAGKRLPTEAEWEKAATWNAAARTKSIWPWGDLFDPARLNSAEAARGDTTKVRQFLEELNHTYDMAGNVAEWTSSLDQPYPYDKADGRENETAAGDRVVRGGSWDKPQEQVRGFVRQAVAPTSVSPSLGFRCAASP